MLALSVQSLPGQLDWGYFAFDHRSCPDVGQSGAAALGCALNCQLTYRQVCDNRRFYEATADLSTSSALTFVGTVLRMNVCLYRERCD